jgi:hypothetical protein
VTIESIARKRPPDKRQKLLRRALKIGATPYYFSGRNLTAYGGLLPVGAMLEKLGFEQLVDWSRRRSPFTG